MRRAKRRRAPTAAADSPSRTGARAGAGTVAQYGCPRRAFQRGDAVAVVAEEQLVGALAGQHDLDVLARQARPAKYSGTLDGNAIGSSSCQTSRGSALEELAAA